MSLFRTVFVETGTDAPTRATDGTIIGTRAAEFHPQAVINMSGVAVSDFAESYCAMSSSRPYYKVIAPEKRGPQIGEVVFTLPREMDYQRAQFSLQNPTVPVNSLLNGLPRNAPLIAVGVAVAGFDFKGANAGAPDGTVTYQCGGSTEVMNTCMTAVQAGQQLFICDHELQQGHDDEKRPNIVQEYSDPERIIVSLVAADLSNAHRKLARLNMVVGGLVARIADDDGKWDTVRDSPDICSAIQQMCAELQCFHTHDPMHQLANAFAACAEYSGEDDQASIQKKFVRAAGGRVNDNDERKCAFSYTRTGKHSGVADFSEELYGAELHDLIAESVIHAQTDYLGMVKDRFLGTANNDAQAGAPLSITLNPRMFGV